MKKNDSKLNRQTPGISRRAIALAVAMVAAGGSQLAHAARFDIDGSDVKVRWDNTFKYTAGWRVESPDLYVANGNFDGVNGQPNTDYGDLAHKRGLINNRLDLLSELDVAYKGFGFRASGAAWFDAEYAKRRNDFPAANPPNLQSELVPGSPGNLNSSGTKNLMGRKGELLDAFVYGSLDLGQESQITVRAGKHTQLYGETLFLGANGIANAQGPVDLIKAFSLPNAQFKEIAIPVGQVSTDIQINQNLSFGAYYQYDWKSMRLPAAGSYFGMSDFIGEGADLLLPPGGGAAFRQRDLKGSDSGNFGARMKFKVADTDYGLYAARYDDKSPIPVFNAIGGDYRLMYARKIDTFGASFSTVFGETNVAGEMSVRRNVALASIGDLIVSTLPNADNEKNTPYARGNSFHLNLSAISVLPGSALWDGASVVGEFAFNRLLSVTHNPVNAIGIAALNTTHTRDAYAMRMVFTPEYFQVMPGVDLQVPIGLGWGISGRSAVFQVAPEKGGDFTIGVNAEIDKTWKMGLNFTHYFGPKGPAPSLNPSTSTYAAYKQYYADRDFVTLTVQRSF